MSAPGIHDRPWRAGRSRHRSLRRSRGVGAGDDDEVGVTPRATAARMRFTISAVGDERLVVQMAAALGLTWSSMWQPHRPSSSNSCTVRAAFSGSPNPVSASMSAGNAVTRAMAAPALGDFGQRRQPDVRQREVGREHRAGDVDALEPMPLDEQRDQRRERAGEAEQFARTRARRGSRRASGGGFRVVKSMSENAPVVAAWRKPVSAGRRQGEVGQLRRGELGQPLRRVQESLAASGRAMTPSVSARNLRDVAGSRANGRAPSGWASATAISLGEHGARPSKVIPRPAAEGPLGRVLGMVAAGPLRVLVRADLVPQRDQCRAWPRSSGRVGSSHGASSRCRARRRRYT